mgnify:CR=1 FL=1
MENGDGGGILLVCMTLVGLPAMLVLLTVLLPSYVERTRDVMRRRPGRSFLLGLVNFVFFLAIALLVNVSFKPVALIGVLSLFIALPVSLSAGLLGATTIAGDRLWRQLAAKQASLMGALALGIPLLGLTLLVPILGWLLFLGLVLAGLGAAIIALAKGLFERLRKNEPQPEPAPGMSQVA